MKYTIPKGSIVVLPNGNVNHLPLTNTRDIVIDSKDFEVYKDWRTYKKSLKEKKK